MSTATSEPDSSDAERRCARRMLFKPALAELARAGPEAAEAFDDVDALEAGAIVVVDVTVAVEEVAFADIGVDVEVVGAVAILSSTSSSPSAFAASRFDRLRVAALVCRVDCACGNLFGASSAAIGAIVVDVAVVADDAVTVAELSSTSSLASCTPKLRAIENNKQIFLFFFKKKL